MKVEILPVQNEGYECYQAAIVSVCNYLKRDYRLMFTNVWKFDYNRELDISKIGHRLIQKDDNNFIQLLEVFHGIKIISHEVNSLEDMINISRSEIKNGLPVVCHIDSYWLKWAPNYEKVHHTHVVLILSVNEQDKSFTCIDPFFSDKEESLPFDIVEKHSTKMDSFVILPEPREKVVWQEILDTAIANMSMKGNEPAFERIRMFAHDMTKEITIAKDSEEMTILMSELKTIRGQRMNFAETLHCLVEKEDLPILSQCALRLEQVASKWKRLNYLLLKMAIRKDIVGIQYKIKELLLQIADEEEAIYVCLGTYEMEHLKKN